MKLGAVTLNEMRDALGLDPYANPAADRPMVLTAYGVCADRGECGGEGANAPTRRSSGSAPLLKDYDPDQPRVPAGNPDGG